MSYSNNIKNGAVILLTSLAIGACGFMSPSIIDRINKLKGRYEGQSDTHAHLWKASSRPREEWCAFLYRDRLLNTKEDDWAPFFQGLAVEIGEQGLNRRRRDMAHHGHDNELFTFRDQDNFCHKIDQVVINLYGLDGQILDHHLVAIPEEAQKKLESLLNERDQSEVEFLKTLKLHYVRPEDVDPGDKKSSKEYRGAFKFD